MLVDGDGGIPDLASALERFKIAEAEVSASKTENATGATTNVTRDEAAIAAYAAAEATRIAAAMKRARNIPLNDAEFEAINAPAVATDTNVGGGDNTDGNGGNNNDFPQGVDGFFETNGVVYYNGSPYTGEFNGKNYVDGKVVETPGGDKYEVVGDVLMFNGKPYTGTYQGKEYVNGKVPTGLGGDDGDKYETINGVLNKNGSPYTGTYGGQEYVDGKLKTAGGGDKYETVNGVFTKNGSPFTGNYGGKSYKDGQEIKTTPGGDTAENAALTAVTAQVTALTAQIAELIKTQTDAAAKAAADAAKPKAIGVKTVRKTGGVVQTVEVMSDGSQGRVIDEYKDFGARDSVMKMFANLGLGTDLINSMVKAIDKVYEENIMPTEDQILNTIYTSDAYNTRFAANKTIRERMASGKGLPGDRVLTPREYIETEKTFKQYMESAGLPVDFYNELNDFTGLIANSVSADELKDRITIAKNVLQTADAEAKRALKEYYGLTDADMVAYLLDKDKAFRAIDSRFAISTPEAQKMYTASEVGGSALRAGMGATKAFAEEITTAGKAGQAEEAFQTTARNQQDYRRLMGLYNETAGEEDLTRQQLSLAGGTEVALKTKKLASKERAKFQTRSAIDRASLTRRLNNPDV